MTGRGVGATPPAYLQILELLEPPRERPGCPRPEVGLERCIRKDGRGRGGEGGGEGGEGDRHAGGRAKTSHTRGSTQWWSPWQMSVAQAGISGSASLSSR